MKRRRVDPTKFAVGFLIFVACLMGLVSNSGRDPETLPRAQFGDSTPLGGKALRLVLERLGYSTALQNEPLQAMPKDARVWLVLDPQTRFSKRESSQLLQWVREGGVLVFCAATEDQPYASPTGPRSAGVDNLMKALGLEANQSYSFTPAKANSFLPELSPLYLNAASNYRDGVKKASSSQRSLSISRPHLRIAGPPGGLVARIENIGKGQVFVAPDALLFTNYALSKDDNAVLVTNLIRAHVPNGKVYFDERQSGENAENVAPPTLVTYLRRPPVSYAILQLMVAGLLFWAFAGRRLGAPVPLPDRGPVTRASQFAAAMGALFSKTNRPQAASALIGVRFRRRLAQRLGLSPAENDTVLAKRAEEVAGIPFEITDRLLLQSRAPVSTVAEALRDAQEMEMVLRKLEGN